MMASVMRANRIKRLAAQEKAKSESVKMPKTPVDNNATEGSKPQVNRRRELYEKVMAMKYTTAQRVRRYERGARASRPDRELLSTQLIVSCENRLKHLQAETTEDMTPSEEDNQQDHDMEKWDPARRVRAWNHHRRAVCSVLDKRHWWQTQLAGEQRDIRRVIVAKSPWEDENKIWIWPRDESSNQEASGATDRVCNPSSVSPWPSMEIHTFLVGGNGSKEQQSQSVKPLNDDEASDWWRAHCTQSHLATNGALLIQNPYSAEFSNNVTNEGDIYPVCTSEVVANRDLYELQRRAKSAARTKSLERDVEQRMKALTAQVERRVHEMKVQVEANTQLALENVRRKEEQRARISREQLAAMTLQRHARGMQGRQCARERRAEFFVMVRGRAIRRGRCEECGDERAVLECQQCEESVHFCPLCWVHVHSTRRRKTHVAMPMATVVALAPVQENKSAKPQILETVTKVEENAAPRLRPLPMPHKQSFTRSAERAPAELKGSLIDTNKRNAMVSKEDAVRSTTTTKATDVRKSATPELAEACALARRVRAKVGHSTDKTGVVPVRRCDAVAATESGPDFPAQESSEDNNEIDFSSMDGDGAAMIESEVPLEEQQIPIESTEGVEAPVEAVQPIEPEPVKLSSEPCSVHAPEEKLHADELLPDTSISVAAHASTTNSEQQEAEAIEVVPDNRPSLESNKSPGGDQCVGRTTEASFTEVTGPENGPAIFEAAAEADTIPSVERPTSTQPSEAQEIPVTAIQVNDVSSTDAGAAHDDMPPSEGSTGEVDHNQAVEEAVTET
ncbi:hypothetical protein PRIC1_011178 [Phytophthora ramorum]